MLPVAPPPTLWSKECHDHGMFITQTTPGNSELTNKVFSPIFFLLQLKKKQPAFFENFFLVTKHFSRTFRRCRKFYHSLNEAEI